MVEWKKMWELTAWDKKFQGVDKSMQSKIIPYKYLLAKDLFALAVPNGKIKLLSTGVQEGWTTEELACDFLSEGEVVTIPWGKSPGAQNPVKYYQGKFVTGDNRIATSIDTNVLNNKFLYYWMYTKSDIIESFYRGAGIQHPNMFKVLTMPVPLLSIFEQERIVGILDTFTASIENLKEQIAQRRKQYEYYRDQLLDLEGKEGVEMKYISQVAKSFTGLTYKPENVSDIGTLVLRSSNIGEEALRFDDNVYVEMNIPDRAIVHEGDLLICVRNGSKRLVGKAAMITKMAEGMAFGAFMTILRSIDINSKYLFYVWHSTKVKKQYKGDEAMPIAQITAKDFQRIIIPVPSLSDQQRIVSILDTFEASIQNLEAQLSQREKQYEYYRNKLLTFE